MKTCPRILLFLFGIANIFAYPFSAVFWQLKNAEQHVGRFLGHPLRAAQDDAKSSANEQARML